MHGVNSVKFNTCAVIKKKVILKTLFFSANFSETNLSLNVFNLNALQQRIN
jgi:hypothetical protein